MKTKYSNKTTTNNDFEQISQHLLMMYVVPGIERGFDDDNKVSPGASTCMNEI